MNNSATADLIAGDYALINSTVSNVENLELANAVGAVDGAQLKQFSTLTFDGAVTDVTNASQALVANDDLTASAVGYVAASGSTAATYAGALNITAKGDGSAITANGASAAVTVQAGVAGDVDVTVGGDLKSGLTINTVNAADSVTTPTADTLASATVDLTTQVALTALTLTGNGSVTVDNSAGLAAKLVTIDASALGGTLAYGTATKGDITGGLTFTANDAVKETIKLGSGQDTVTTNSTYDKIDTITGFDAVQESATANKSVVDVLTFGGLTLDGSSAVAGIVKMALNTATDTSLDLAFTHAAAYSAVGAAGAGKVVQFAFGGDTYLFKDAGATVGQLDGADFAVKLAGQVDLTTAFATHVA